MASTTKAEREREQARKAQVKAYENAIANMEEDNELFYKHQLEREKISAEEYAAALKERSERYAQYSKDVLELSYATNEEKLALSREYMQKSEAALTEYIKRTRALEQAQAKAIAEANAEAARQSLDAAMESSYSYMQDRNYYSNWQEMHDDPVSAFRRVDQRLSEAVLAGNMTYDEYYDQLEKFGTAMYDDRIANSNRWLAHEREMNRITSEEYIAGLYRMRDYTQEYYSAGIISHRQYTDGLQALDERIFNERKAQHQEILRQAEREKDAVDEAAQAKIDALKKQYNASIAAIDEDNRRDELAYLQAQEKIYSKAETREGKERLADIREDIDRIREEERRIALKENLEASTQAVLTSAERKKAAIDRNAARAALDLGLYYDEETGYKMINHVSTTLDSVLREQESFSRKSRSELTIYNSELGKQMNESTQTVASSLLTSFQVFAAGINAIKNQVFADVASLNSLKFPAIGGINGKTSITYNDYGDKNITGSGSDFSFFDTIRNLIAKGGRL